MTKLGVTVAATEIINAWDQLSIKPSNNIKYMHPKCRDCHKGKALWWDCNVIVRCAIAFSGTVGLHTFTSHLKNMKCHVVIR